MTDLVVQRGRARFGARIMPCAIGHGGLTHNKREGDGATPIGTHRILSGFWRADRMPQPPALFPMQAIGTGMLWSDDPRDSQYNSLVRAPYGFSHEQMRRADPLYDLVLVTDWNMTPPVPGRGSAIFLHIWRRPGWATEGCVAFAKRDLLWIAAHWSAHSRIIVQP